MSGRLFSWAEPVETIGEAWTNWRGERFGLWEYLTRKVACTEEEAWQFTAVCHFAGASGGYRGPAGDTYAFMTFHDVAIGNIC